MIVEYCIPEFEWEFSNFPLTVTQIEFEKTSWGFDSDITINIWRNKSLALQGSVIGKAKTDPYKFDDEHYIGKGNIIEGQILFGVDKSGNIIRIEGCILSDFKTNSQNLADQSFYVECSLHIDSLKITQPHTIPSNNVVCLYWFICNNISAHFPETTFRKKDQKRVRVGIDKYDDSTINLSGSSSSKDYFLVKVQDIEFIVAKVPNELVPAKKQGICLEFRKDLDKINNDLINDICNFLSFLLGDELLFLGYSVISNDIPIEFSLNNLINTVGHTNENSMPPIKFNFKYQWGDIYWLVNQLLPKYLKLLKSLPLRSALSRYWISRKTPLGANLPVLASAMEILAEKYLSTIDGFKLEYLSKDEYYQLINTEIEVLTHKLSSIEGGDKIMNKITGAFRKGPNEKIAYFFIKADIQIGKMEKKAIALRNTMAHGSTNYSNKENIYTDLIYTRVYEVLFHRIVLKLLGYDGYYIDYSLKGCPLKHIDKFAGQY